MHKRLLRFASLLSALLLAVLATGCASPEKPPPATPTAKPVPFPEDGRVVVNAREYPWSALGRLNTGGRGHCTGVLVSARHVLASAPCLYNRVEGRWWHRSELHFVAGYQRDTYIANSPVARVVRAPAYQPGAGLTLGNVTQNWALVELSDPIGRYTGWLGLEALDQDLRRRLSLGEAQLAPAGYRRGRPHAIVLNLGCGLSGPVLTASGNVPNCEVMPGDSALPPLVFADGVRAASGQLSADARGPLGRALTQAGISPGPSQAPRPGRGTEPLPLATIDYFLIHLGYLGTTPESPFHAPSEADRAAAIRDFQSRNGLPVDGRPSIALLGYLIRAAQPAPAVG